MAAGGGSAPPTTRSGLSRKKMRELMGLNREERVPSATTVELWLGIFPTKPFVRRPDGTVGQP